MIVQHTDELGRSDSGMRGDERGVMYPYGETECLLLYPLHEC